MFGQDFDPEKIKEFMAKHKGNAQLPAVFAGQMEPYITTEVNKELMAGLFLEARTLLPGESAEIFVEPGYSAVVIDHKGRPFTQPVEAESIEPPNYKVGCLLKFLYSDLEMGKVRPLDAQGDTASALLNDKIDAACIAAALAAVPVSQTITCPGGALTEQALKSGFVAIEDREKSVGGVFARAARITIDMGAFQMSDSVKDEFVRRGAIKTWGGAAVAKTSRIPMNRVLLTAGEMVGRCSIVYGPTVKPYYGVEPGYIALYAEAIVRIGIGKPHLLAAVAITD
jgi:hypothetical protein